MAIPCRSRAYRMGPMSFTCSSRFMAALITSIPSVSPVQRVSWARSLQRQLPGSQVYVEVHVCRSVHVSHVSRDVHKLLQCSMLGPVSSICTRIARHLWSRCCWANSDDCRVSWKAVGRGPKYQDLFAVLGFSSVNSALIPRGFVSSLRLSFPFAARAKVRKWASCRESGV